MGQPGTGTGGFAAPTSNAGSTAPTAPAGGVSNGGFGDGRGGTGDGGFGATTAAPAQSAGGGFFSSLGHDLGSVGHFVSSRAATGGKTLMSMGTGLYSAGKAGVYEPWKNFFTTGHPYSHNAGAAVDKATNQVFAGAVEGPVNAVKDIGSGKFHDPIGDLVMLSPFAHGLARTGVGAAEAGSALRAGEGVGAATKAFRDPSFLKAPRMVNEPGREPVSLYASHNAARRIVQAGIDRGVNKALANDRANGLLGHEGPVATYGRQRMGGTLAERARAGIRYHQALIANTRVAGRGVAQFAKSIRGTVEDPQLTAQALLHSLHDNVLPAHEAIFHEIQAQKGINPEQNAAWAQAFTDASKLGVVHLSEDNRVMVDPNHPLAAPLAKSDSALEKLGAYAENQLVTRGLREPSTLEDRNARVSQLVQRSKPLLGEEPLPLREARRSLVNAQAKHEANLQSEADWRGNKGQKTVEGYRSNPGPNLTLGGKRVEGIPEASNPWRNKVVLSGQKLEAAQSRVTSFEDRYGLSSPDRRAAMQQGVHAREQIAEAAHRLFGDQAPHHLAQIEGFARQYARTHDVTPHEFYAQFLRKVETPGTIGSLPPDALAEIDAFHGFPSEKTEANLRAKHNPRTQKNGLPLNKTMLTKEGVHFAGKITPEQWLQRVGTVMKTAAERDHAARWYEHFEPLFREEFPPEVADKIIRGFSVSQANASPSAGVASTLAALERMSKGEEVGSIGSVVAANIEKALKGEHIDSHVAGKLSDFIDALRGESTRTWMGHKVEGGAPAPIDIWGLRDLGYWDKKILTKGRGARLAKMHGVDTSKLAADNSGSAAGARYERAAEQYHAITDHLNATNFDGRNDWTPAQVQALGWASIQKFYGQVPEDLATAIAKGKVRSQGIITRGYVVRAVEESKAPDGGFTLHSDMTPDAPDQGFAVALAPYEQRVPAQDFTPKDLQSYVARHRAVLQRDPSLRVGGWHNPKDGLVYLDLSRVVPTREEAMALAREHGQLSAFDRAAAAHGDWENAFPQSGLSAAEADAIKGEARARAQAPEAYRQVIHSMAEKLIGRKPTALDMKYTEDKLHATADARPEDPTSQALKKLYSDAHDELQRRQPQPEELFQAAWGNHEFSPEAPHPLAGAGKASLADLEGANRLIPPSEDLQRGSRQAPEPTTGSHAYVGGSLLPSEGELAARSTPDAYQAGTLHSAENGQRILGSYKPSTGTMALSSEHAVPDTILHEALHAVRQSLAPGVQEIARRMYAPNGWDRAAEEHFVNDMVKVQHGDPVSPEVQRLFTMTHDYLPGRGYVPMTVWEDARQPHSPMASSGSQIVGAAKSPINSHFATGEAMAQGLRRTDVGDAVTAHVQKLFRYFNTLDTRELSAQHGGDTYMSKDDTLMRVDRRTEAGFKLPAGRIDEHVKEVLGILENKTGLPAPEEEGLSAGVAAALNDLVGNLFPGHFAPHSEVTLADGTKTTAGQLTATAERGVTKAPPGYVWVPKQLARLKDLEASITRGEPGKVARFADNTNGAITAATVYYKIGHLFTRVFTNAATNIMQGSAAPWEIARSVALSREITPEEMQQSLAYAGTHYFEAAPGATGSTVIGRGMQKGLHVPFTDKALRTRSGEAVMSPQWWAHNIDAPFRFNSIAYEARKAGYEGVDGFRQLLQHVENYNSLDAAERARVDGVLRRADREAIAYDRLNQLEKRVLSRVIWFYPWVKGSTVFTANTMFEHPFKAAALYSAGEAGTQEQQKQLGDMPSYAQGLTPWTGGDNPIVSDLNTFNPAGTAAGLLQTPEHLGNIAGMANPLYGAALSTAQGVNPYGVQTPTPIKDNLLGLLSTAPEYQIAKAATDHGDQSHRLYPGGHGMSPLYKNWLGELIRALGGPAMPRHVNPAAGHSLAQRERTGR